MADQEEGRSSPPTQPPPLPRPYTFGSETLASSATGSEPTVSPVAKVASDSLPIGAEESGSEEMTPEMARRTIAGSRDRPTAYRADLEGGRYEVKGSDFGKPLTPDVQALVVLRPVEVMLRDPLSDVARKERRNLLGISAIALLVGWTGLVPAKIENFGISFAAPERRALLWLFLAVVGYYTLAFIVYAFSDFLSYVYAVHQGRVELRKQRQERPASGIGSLRLVEQPVETHWSLGRFVTPASLARGVFDFIIPMAVAGFAMWSLWGAVHQVATIAAPSAPAVAPSVPHDSVPSLKTVPPVSR